MVVRPFLLRAPNEFCPGCNQDKDQHVPPATCGLYIDQRGHRSIRVVVPIGGCYVCTALKWDEMLRVLKPAVDVAAPARLRNVLRTNATPRHMPSGRVAWIRVDAGGRCPDDRVTAALRYVREAAKRAWEIDMLPAAPTYAPGYPEGCHAP